MQYLQKSNMMQAHVAHDIQYARLKVRDDGFDTYIVELLGKAGAIEQVHSPNCLGHNLYGERNGKDDMEYGDDALL